MQYVNGPPLLLAALVAYLLFGSLMFVSLGFMFGSRPVSNAESRRLVCISAFESLFHRVGGAVKC